MKHALLLVLLLASIALGSETISTSFTSDYGDVTVLASNVLATVEWKKDQPLPLSPQNAIKAVEKQLPRQGDDWWRIESVDLTSFDYGRWFYVVRYSHVLDIFSRDRSYVAVVLMNGTIMPPKPQDTNLQNSVAPWLRYEQATDGHRQRPYQPDYRKWRSITNGMTKDAVRAALGYPIPYGGGGLDSARSCNPWRFGWVADGYEFTVAFSDDKVMHKADPFNGNFSTNGVPTTPELIYPHTNTLFTHYPRVVDFRWSPSSGEYPIEYQLDAGSGSIFTFEPHGTALMSGMGQHRWRLRAINRLGVSPWTEWRVLEFTE